MRRSFSFLYRNERTATIQCIADIEAAVSFQFPLSERTNCNNHRAAVANPVNLLSVSSIGTNELQLTNQNRRRRKMGTFSFLYRNERTATSVIRRIRHAQPVFQFPLSERTNCNTLYRLLQNLRYRLSVSSIGTNELQLILFPPWAYIIFSFSFLYRNERTATRLPKFVRRLIFQLSVSSIGTNELQRSVRDNTLDRESGFQFPLSERTNCNPILDF